MRLLELIDKIYTEILPLGSVIQINREKVTQKMLLRILWKKCLSMY